MAPNRLPVNLTDAQIEEFGRELDAIREEVIESRGERDRQYILRLIKIQRSLALGGRVLIFASILALPAWGHAYASNALFWLLITLGTLSLGLAKIIENMEIGHNILHAQWDWMKDDTIQSSTWEWDHVCPSDQWMHSHNVRHHTWTNVLGKDPDIGYGLLRMSGEQRWKPFYLGQPLYALLLALLFEWGIAIQELELGKFFTKKGHIEHVRPQLRRTGKKIAAQVRKDYLMWPLLGVVLTLPFTLSSDGQCGGVFAAQFVDLSDHFLRPLSGRCLRLHQAASGERNARRLVCAAAARVVQHPWRQTLSCALRQPVASDRASPVPRPAKQSLSATGPARACVGRPLRFALQQQRTNAPIRHHAMEDFPPVVSGWCGG